MQQLNNKVDGAAGATGSLPADEWNQVPSELQNIITDTGQTLNSGDLDQVGKSVAAYSGGGDFYSAGGTANAIALSVVGSKQSPPGYFDGMRVRFTVGLTNTSATTVNVASLGVKSIKLGGGDLIGGELVVGESVELAYDSTNGWFSLERVGAPDRVNSLAALRERGGVDNAVGYLRGRTSIGDGGQGDFYWDSSDLSTEVATDEVTAGEGDGGVYIAPASDKTGASGAWVRLYSGAADVKWYGAKGDGVTDDTIAVSAADAAGLPVIDGKGGEYLTTLTAITTKFVNGVIVLADGTRNYGYDTRAEDTGTSVFASLPRFMRKLSQWDHDSQVFTIVGMGSSVGAGATLPDAATQAPVVKFAEYFNTFVNTGSIHTINVDNRSVGGSTIFNGNNTDWAALLGAGVTPDIVVLCYGMNDYASSQYNSGSSFDNTGRQLRELIQKIHDYGADAVLVTTPHNHSTRTDFGLAASIGMTYPTRSWALTETFSFDSTLKKITATTAGAFNNAAYGFGLSVGKTINVADGANAGDYTVATIDASGDFITVTEAVPSTTSYATTVKRVAIDDETELVPPVSASVVTADHLGNGTSTPASYRFLRGNDQMRQVAHEMGVPVIDTEKYWFEAINDLGEDALFDVGEFNHPNLTGHQLSYWRAMERFVRSLKKSVNVPSYRQDTAPDLSAGVSTSGLGSGTQAPKREGVLDIQSRSDKTYAAVFRGTDQNIDATRENDGSTTERAYNATRTSYYRKAKNRVFLGNKSALENIPVPDAASGELFIFGYNSGIPGKEILRYLWESHGGAVYVSLIGSHGTAGSVITVGTSVLNITVTPTAANTNIVYELTTWDGNFSV